MSETKTNTEKQEKPEKSEKPKKLKPAELLEQIKVLESKNLYLQADYQNFRKRTAKDISDARLIGTVNAIEPFLKINDFLIMAKMAAEKSDNIEALKQGVLMIINEYEKAMDEFGVTKLKTVGEKFDPELHEAISHEFSDTVEEGIVIKEFSSGYKLGSKLLKAARVVVSKGKEIAQENPVDETTSTDEDKEQE